MPTDDDPREKCSIHHVIYLNHANALIITLILYLRFQIQRERILSESFKV